MRFTDLDNRCKQERKDRTNYKRVFRHVLSFYLLRTVRMGDRKRGRPSGVKEYLYIEDYLLIFLGELPQPNLYNSFNSLKPSLYG